MGYVDLLLTIPVVSPAAGFTTGYSFCHLFEMVAAAVPELSHPGYS